MGQKIKSDQYFTALRANRDNPTAALVLEDGSVFTGYGFGAAITNVGEICFNTSMTGYQEILTDPSYAGQIITFTFPHIGNVGANNQDFETIKPAALGLIVRQAVTNPASWRATSDLDSWLKTHNLPGISGIDTRALTRRIRDLGAPHATICHAPDGKFDIAALQQAASSWPGLEGMDLAKDVSCRQSYTWDETAWALGEGYGTQTDPKFHVVAVDFGAKRNILRDLAHLGCKVTVVPANTTAEEVLSHKPDGVFLSNGPGDPGPLTGIRSSVAALLGEVPIFGICLGHQLLAGALGAETYKLQFGHHGGNHPVRNLATGRVEITSQNHNYCVADGSIPSAQLTHVNLNDQTVEGIRCSDVPAFSVQYHPEAGPGPHDSRYLFAEFEDLMASVVGPAKGRG